MTEQRSETVTETEKTESTSTDQTQKESDNGQDSDQRSATVRSETTEHIEKNVEHLEQK